MAAGLAGPPLVLALLGIAPVAAGPVDLAADLGDVRIQRGWHHGSSSCRLDDMNLTVRQGTFADLDAVAVLFDRYRVYQGRDPDLTAARSFLRDRFDHGQSVVFLALRDDLPAGFAQLYPSFSSVALARVFVLNDLFVCETCRRIGVASSLLEAVERYAWSLGASRVTLNVDKTNASGLALYEASGWKRDEQFHMYHRLP